MRRKRLTQTEQRARTRARLLEAAEHVFAERGFHAASVEEIAEQAGFSTGALYWNFANKEDLFVALFEEHTARRLEDVQAIAGSEKQAEGARERFAMFVENEPHWPLLFYEFWAYAVREPRVRPDFVEGRRRLRAKIAEAFERTAAETGHPLPAKAEELAVAANALANGIATERLVDPEVGGEDLFERMLAIFLQGVIAASRDG